MSKFLSDQAKQRLNYLLDYLKIVESERRKNKICVKIENVLGIEEEEKVCTININAIDNELLTKTIREEIDKINRTR